MNILQRLLNKNSLDNAFKDILYLITIPKYIQTAFKNHKNNSTE